MRKKSYAFENFHPALTLYYFGAMSIMTLSTLHVIYVSISLLGALFSTAMLIGFRKTGISLLYSIPLAIMAWAVYPMFSHRGETYLFFLNDNAVTLESILCGGVQALMLLALFYWLKCLSTVMTSDKYIYLFGKAIPKIGLILSLLLAFLPKLKKRYKQVSAVQKSMGMYTSKSITDRVYSRVRVMAGLIGWMAENYLQISDSMNARGYRLKCRSSMALYSWSVRDTVMFLFLFAVFSSTAMALCFATQMYYYPTIIGISFSKISLLGYIAFTTGALWVSAAELREDIRWRLLMSKI